MENLGTTSENTGLNPPVPEVQPVTQTIVVAPVKGSLKHVDTPARQAARAKANQVRLKNKEERAIMKANEAKMLESLKNKEGDPKAESKKRLLDKLAQAIPSSESENDDKSTSTDESVLVKYVQRQVKRKKEKAKAKAAELVELYRTRKRLRGRQSSFESEESEEEEDNQESSQQASHQFNSAAVVNNPTYAAQPNPNQASGSISSQMESNFKQRPRVVFL